MAKRRKKQSFKPPVRPAGDAVTAGKPPGISGPSNLQRRAEEQLALGQTGRAQAGFRRLFQKEPGVYRARYVEVTMAVIRECLTEGGWKEALRLVKEMEGIGESTDELCAHKLTIAVGQGDFDAATGVAARLLSSQEEGVRLQAGDALVLAQAPEAQAVNAAIALLCRRDWDGMRQELQVIAHKSPFAHWRLFLRGCAALWQKEDEEAERCFARLPAGTVPARKALALRVCNGGASPSSDDRVLSDACILAGNPEFAVAYPGIQRLWEQGRYRAAYQASQRTGTFPTYEVSLQGQLTRFFEFAHVGLGERKFQTWLKTVIDLGGSRPLRPNAEGLLLGGILARLADNVRTADLADTIWTHYFKVREKVLGSSPRFYALCHYFRALAQLPCACGLCFTGEPEHRRSIRSLLRSSEADPTFEDAPLRLLDIYRKLNMHPEANRLLDDMAVRFPRSKKTLLEAGRACLKRKAYAKGLGFLRRAREIDPLDKSILEAIFEALEATAIACYRKQTAAQIGKARQAFGEILNAIPHGAPLLQSRGATLVRWACLEDFFVEPSASLAQEKLAECGPLLNGCALEFYRVAYLKSLASRFRTLPRSGKVLPRTTQLAGCDPRGAIQLVQFWNHLRRSEDDFRLDDVWFNFVHGRLSDMVDGLGLADRDAARMLWAELDRLNLTFAVKLAFRVVRRMLSLDPADPYFTCLAWDASEKVPSREEIEAVQQEAHRRGDLEALKLCVEEVSGLESGCWEEDDGDEEEDEDFDPEDHGEVDPFEGSTGFPSGGGKLEIPERLLPLLKGLPPKARIALLMATGMSREQAELASGRVSAAGLPQPGATPGSRGQRNGGPRPGRRSTPSEPDLVQTELPF